MSSQPFSVSGSVVARAILSVWRATGRTAEAAAILAERPELAEDRNAILELAYEEFWDRYEAGEKIDVEEFCARFPGYQDSIRRMLSKDQYFGDHPSMVDASKLNGGPFSEPSNRLPNLTLRRELGRGSFARVYLAEERSAGNRPVAVKITRSGEGEAQLLGRLHHDHIAPILWADRHPERELDIVCMPFLGSATLLDVQKHLYPGPGTRPPGRGEALLDAVKALAHPEDPVPDQLLAGPSLHDATFVEGAVRLTVPIASALAFIHQRGLAHCDLKPANILLTPLCRPMLLDFNLSRSPRMRAGGVGGTPPYMAPEVIRAYLYKENLTVQQAAHADLFSLGVILYELLTGVHPFGPMPKDEPVEKMAKEMLARQQAEVRRADQLNPAIPGALAELLARCMSVNPADRPASAEELAESLRPWQGPIRRQRRMAAVLALCCFGVTLGVLLGQVPVSRVAKAGEGSVLVQREELRTVGLRELEQGQRLMRDGKKRQARVALLKAGDRFRRVIDLYDNEPLPGAWLDYHARGRSLMLLDRCTNARSHFLETERLYRVDGARLAVACWTSVRSPLATLTALPLQGSDTLPDGMGPILACLSYCATRLGHHKPALQRGQDALNSGFRSAGLLNNLGYSHLQLREQRSALAHFEEAIRCDPTHVTARYNRILIAHREKLRQPRSAIPDWALPDLDEMLDRFNRNRPAPTETYRAAVHLYALATIDAGKVVEAMEQQQDDQPKKAVQLAQARRLLAAYEQRTRDYALRCCVLGVEPASLRKHPDIKRALGKWLEEGHLDREESQGYVATGSRLLADPLSGALR